VDASFANENYKSTTGYVILCGNTPIMWKSIKQRITARSTADSEFVAVATAADDAIWLEKLIRQIGICTEVQNHSNSCGPAQLYSDSQVAIRDCKLEQHQPLSKHVGVRHAWIVDMIRMQILRLDYVKSIDMIADGLTKALGKNLHVKLIESMNLVCHTSNRGFEEE
jgi:hypothetical protein